MAWIRLVVEYRVDGEHHGCEKSYERQPHRSSPTASAEAGAAVEDAARLPVQNQRSLLRLGCVELSRFAVPPLPSRRRRA